MNKQFFGKIILGVMAAFLFMLSAKEKAAFGETITGTTGIGGISDDLDSYYDDTTESEKDSFLVSIKNNYSENVAIANVTSVLNIRSKAGTSNSKVGLLYPGSAVNIISSEPTLVNNEEWVEVESGDVTGFVCAQWLYMGEAGQEKADEIKTLCATATVKSGVSLNVRSAPSTSADILLKVASGEQMTVSKTLVVNKAEEANKLWVEILLDSDSDDENSVGYVSLDYVSLNYELSWAVKYTPYGANVSDARVAICDEAMKYLGTKYVWGGNDPYKGIDCSGLVNYVFKHVSYTKNLSVVINMPRVSADMQKTFTAISRSELKPGDLVFYANSTKVFHVAIYIGNGKIIHSSTNFNGVAVSSIDFISPKKMYYARIIDD